MLFNSYIFVFFFLPVSVVGYFVLNRIHYEMAKIYLLGMSLWFYAYFNIRYVPIIVLSICLNFGLTFLMNKPLSAVIKKWILIIGVAGNIGVLFYFKYYNFFVENINLAFGSSFMLHHLVLPLGISFFTFQQLSYVIDNYYGGGGYCFVDYALFVTFFPQLIAGPIVTHDEIVPQFADPAKSRINWENLSKGLYAFAFGLGKKVLLADILGKAVAWGFGDIASLDSTNALLVMLCYTLQIYFDFSGYCDMATGIGLMFNIEIPMNFNSPYRALTITDFWKRWHITLTRFFTRYVYIPLGGNRKGILRTYINIFMVFFVSGLWHGANWTFLVWGIMHGVASVLTRFFKRQIDAWHPAFQWLVTFGFLNVTWVFFRADSVGQALTFLKRIAILNIQPIHSSFLACFTMPEFTALAGILHSPWIGNVQLLMVAWLGLGLMAALLMKNTNERIAVFQPGMRSALATVVLTVWSVLSFASVSIFLYFNF